MRLRNHGLLAVGSSLREAASVAEVVERTAEIIMSCYAAGREPASLPGDVLAALRQLGQTPGMG